MIDVLMWDYDGTLADSHLKNYRVTFEVLRRAVPRLFENPPAALSSPEAFFEAVKKHENWRELYRVCYGMTDEEVERSGSLWGACQKTVSDVPPLFDGMEALLRSFSDRKMAIVSQNASDEIAAVLAEKDLLSAFDFICGYLDVPQFSPKPSVVPFLKCAEKLPIDTSSEKIVYVGDHEEDVLFAENIRRYFRERGENIDIVSVAVSYSGSDPSSWKTRPDFTAATVSNLREVLAAIDNAPR